MIVSRVAPVERRWELNEQLHKTLEKAQYRVFPRPEYLNDVVTQRDFFDWTVYGLAPLFREQAVPGGSTIPGSGAGTAAGAAGGTGSTGTTVFGTSLAGSSNFLVPVYDNVNAPVVRFSLKRPKLVANKVAATAKIFAKVWTTFEVGDDDNGRESVIAAKYLYDGTYEGSAWTAGSSSSGTSAGTAALGALLPMAAPHGPPAIGTDSQGGNLSAWSQLTLDDEVHVDWQFNRHAGYDDRGGFLALLHIGGSAEGGGAGATSGGTGVGGAGATQDTRTTPTAFLLRLQTTPDSAFLGNEVPVDKWHESKLGSSETSNWIVDFLLFNPRLNAVTHVAVKLIWNAAGALSSKQIQLRTILLAKEATSALDLLGLIFLLWTIFNAVLFLFEVRSMFRRHSFQQFLSKTLYSYWTLLEITALILGPLTLAEHKIYAGKVDEIRQLCERGEFLPHKTVMQAEEHLRIFDRMAAFAVLLLFFRIVGKLKTAIERVALLE